MTFHTIAKIESGATPDPRIETVKKIANALGVGIDDLMKSQENTKLKRKTKDLPTNLKSFTIYDLPKSEIIRVRLQTFTKKKKLC